MSGLRMTIMTARNQISGGGTSMRRLVCCAVVWLSVAVVVRSEERDLSGRVVDDAGQRALLGGLRHQRQRGESHQEAVGCRTSAQPEHGGERFALRGRQLAEVVQQRCTQLMQAAVGQLHFRLDPYGRRDMPAGDPARQVAQQSTLAHARLTAQDQDTTRTREHVRHEPVERSTLVTTSEQLAHGTTP